MIKVIVITHGQLGAEILRTAESIVGKQENAVILTLTPQESLSTMVEKVGQALKDIDGNGALILTDMLGGTPCNACLPFCNTKNIEVITGVNLYMILSSFINRNHMDLKDLASKVINDGKKSINNAKEIFLKKLK
ncbi:MAG: PTS mannose transporter subunit IIAB [Elusimicrobia bacterium]|nr:PTS mannose transporter subunit IIAB [Candidatus Liberimonas magnetica]